MAIDLDQLWNFGNPQISEERFRAALSSAAGDDALILQTQIARTYGLRRDFATAKQLLATIEPKVAHAGAEARARYALEWGRQFASATHPPASLTPEAKELARAAFTTAFEVAKTGALDGLAIDALHMLAFVDPAPLDQLAWGQAALAIAESSTQPRARRWEASLHNNIGYALHQLGRYEEALEAFNKAVLLRAQQGDAGPVRIAYWMVAWTLRALHRYQEALQIQVRLARENDAAGTADPHVFAELELLYRALGGPSQANHYAQRRLATAP